jgi:D-alanine-D-alanine ligase
MFIIERIQSFMARVLEGEQMMLTHFEGGIKWPPMIETTEGRQLFEQIKEIAKKIDVRISEEHRWSSADICNINTSLAKIDGLGPVGGIHENQSEQIFRFSLIDRALLLAMLLVKKV